jgi:hypothetical protein
MSNTALYKCTRAEQFDSNLSSPTGKRMPRRIRYKLAHDHS